MKTLTLSHSSASTFGLCPQLYRMRYVLGLSGSPGCGHDANFGIAMHAGLATWHLTRDFGKAERSLMQRWQEPADFSDPRTLGFAKQLLREYGTFWRQDAELPGQRDTFSETLLAMDLGMAGDTLVRFAGTMDLILVTKDAALVLDFKTTALGWAPWWAMQRVSSQWPAYASLVKASKLCGQRHPKVLVRYISTRLTEDDRFREAMFEFSDEQLAEWKNDTLALAGEILRGHETNVWRHERSACPRQFGRACEFYDHCILPPGSRERDLRLCGTYKPRKPSPTEQNVKLGLGERDDRTRKGKR